MNDSRLAALLMELLEVDPCEHVTWGTNDSINDLAARLTERGVTVVGARLREAAQEIVAQTWAEDLSDPTFRVHQAQAEDDLRAILLTL